MIKGFRCLGGAGLFWLTICSGSASAAAVTWLPTSGTNAWNATPNWNTDSLPTSADAATFTSTGTQTVSLAGGIGSIGATGNVGNLTASTGGGILTFDKTTASDVYVAVVGTVNLGGGAGDQIVVSNSSGAGTFLFAAYNAGNFNVNATMTATGTGVTVGSVGGFLNMRYTSPTLLVQNGATARGRGMLLDGDGSNVTLRVTGAGSTLRNTDNAIQLGATTAAGNKLIVENGAALNSTGNILINAGTLILDGGTMNFNAKNITLQNAAARFEADGTLTAGTVVSTKSGAVAVIGGDDSFGSLTATVSGGAGWNNANLLTQFEIGDLTGTPVAGTDYDFLNVVGNFTLGGTVQIDLTGATLPGELDGLKLIGWTSYSGAVEDLSVSFIGGSPLNYEVLSDGLYVTVVPEPSAFALAGIGMGGLLLVLRRRRA